MKDAIREAIKELILPEFGVLKEEIRELKGRQEEFGLRLGDVNQHLLELNRRIDAVREELTARIDETNKRIDAVREELTARIDETNKRIDETNKRIDAVREELTARIDETNRRIDETNTRIDNLTLEVGALKAEVRDLKSRQEAIADILARLQRLENKVFA